MFKYVALEKEGKINYYSILKNGNTGKIDIINYFDNFEIFGNFDDILDIIIHFELDEYVVKFIESDSQLLSENEFKNAKLRYRIVI